MFSDLKAHGSVIIKHMFSDLKAWADAVFCVLGRKRATTMHSTSIAFSVVGACVPQVMLRVLDVGAVRVLTSVLAQSAALKFYET
jgi:hypothetical protein